MGYPPEERRTTPRPRGHGKIWWRGESFAPDWHIITGMAEVIGAHPSDGRPMVLVEARAEWRAWLEQNHNSKGAWLVSWKKATGRPFIPYPETVDEALCFGWVDSRPNRLDEELAMRLFTPRKPRSPWSRLNKEKVARLSAEGLMAPAGMRMVETAQANGSWTVYDEIEDVVIPPDLADALAEDETAPGFFERFPESSKKAILWWIKTAKRPETRAARIAETVSAAAQNRMADHFAGPRG